MKQPFRVLFALSLPTAVAVIAAPERQTVVFDPARTTIQFTLGAVLHTVRGAFKLTRGAMQFDPATGSATGELVIDARTGDSGNDARDSRMHNDILESARYPDIVFVPDRIQGHLSSTGPSHIQVHGLFTIHGQAHEVTLPVDVQAAGPEITAATQLAIPYVKWGMKNPSTLLLRVSQTVDIQIKAVARIDAAAP